MEISPEMGQFKLKLEEAYSETRAKIPPDSPDDQLVENPDYKRCVLIYNVIGTIFNKQEGYDWGEIAAAMDDFDVDKFLKRYSVAIVKGKSGYKIEFNFADEQSEDRDRQSFDRLKASE